MASKPIFQFKAELVDSHIPIWREFQVLSDVTFGRLAYILMTLFEMQASHLFCFDVDMASGLRNRNYSGEEFDNLINLMQDSGDRYLKVELPWDEVYQEGFRLNTF